MKKAIYTLLFITAFTVMGQEQKNQKPENAYHKKMTPEQTATLKTKKMALALDLSKDQQAKVEKLNLENAKLRQSKMEGYKAKKENGELKKPTSEERFAMANTRLDQQIAFQGQMKQILNEDQFEKWKSMEQREGRHHLGHNGYGGHNGEKRGRMHGKK